MPNTVIKKVLIVDPSRETFDLYAETLQGVPKSWLQEWDDRGPKLIEQAKVRNAPFTHAIVNGDAIGAKQAATVLGQNPGINVTWVSKRPFANDESSGMLQKLKIKEISENEVRESGAVLYLMQKFDDFQKEHARRSDVTAARAEFNQDIEDARRELRRLVQRQDVLDSRIDDKSILLTRLDGRVMAIENRLNEWSSSMQRLTQVQGLLNLMGKIATLLKDWWVLVTTVLGAIAFFVFERLK
jgi:hypothetical protein